MSWFLIILLWNPGLEVYELAPDWPVPGYTTEARCDARLAYIDQYIPNSPYNVTDCIEAKDAETAVAIAKR